MLANCDHTPTIILNLVAAKTVSLSNDSVYVCLSLICLVQSVLKLKFETNHVANKNITQVRVFKVHKVEYSINV